MAIARSWSRPADSVARALDTDTTVGLTDEEAARRLLEDGRNELVAQDRPTVATLVLRQLVNTMTIVLAAAAVITVVIGDATDAVVIGVIVVLNTVVGFVQEHRAERAVDALRDLTTGTATVVRAGVTRAVPVPDVVRGDLVRLAAGDVVAADVRLVTVHALRVDEASLTGESEPVAKDTDAIADGGAVLVGDQRNMVFKGTAVTYGRGTGVVVATGMDTELGQIAELLQAHDLAPTPLQRRLAQLGRRLAAAAIVVCVAVFLAGVATGEAVDTMLLTAVSLAVAAIPEGLPAVVTVALALGAHRMASRRALIRHLPAVETLGSIAVICTDKTGTLTQNRMTVERVWTPRGSYEVTGVGYAPDGDVVPAADDPYLDRVARVAASCNDAVLHAPSGPGEWTVTGDPTEGALLALAGKLDVTSVHPRRAEIAFDANRRMMTTAHARDGGCWVATKGALVALTPLLDPTEEPTRRAAEQAADELAGEGYRVLALAERHLPAFPERLDELEHALHLVGIVGVADPPRPEARAAIDRCRAAGITPVMVTGDHPRTALAIARRLGLVDHDAAGALLTGAELDALDDRTLADRIADIRVFARTTPDQKVRIVRAWKASGVAVAMTGDGVNDAPALRDADIGVAMGVIGTDVSREAADMVLADDNFATIVAAVEEGRRIYDNIRRFVRYILATNSGEVLVMALAPVVGLPIPLAPAQILWINLVTDGPPAIALSVEPAEPDAMQRPPRPARESILGAGLWQRAASIGLLIGALAIGVQAVSRSMGWPARTMVFTTLAFLQLANALAVRSSRGGNPWVPAAVAFGIAAQLATIYVPVLQGTFDTTALGAGPLAVTVAVPAAAWALMRRAR